jgi:glycogen operon protein
VVKFKLPEVTGGATYLCLLDTNVPDRDEAPRFRTGDEYEVTGRSLLLFMLQPDGRASPAVRAAVRALRRTVEAASLVAAIQSEEPAERAPERESAPEPAE